MLTAHKADPALPKPSQRALRRQLNGIKHEQGPWMADVTGQKEAGAS